MTPSRGSTPSPGAGRPFRRGPLTLVLSSAVALVAVVGLLGACSSSRASGPGRTDVTMVGDSLGVLGGGELTDTLDRAGWKLEIDAFPGVTTLEQMPVLAKAAKSSTGAFVVELGTNDAHAIERGESSEATERSQINSALDLFGSDCVVWVNVDSNPSRPGGKGGIIVNAALAAQAVNRPNLHIVDLDGLLAAHPEYLVGDEVHLTTEGYQALGDLIAAQLDACR